MCKKYPLPFLFVHRKEEKKTFEMFTSILECFDNNIYNPTIIYSYLQYISPYYLGNFLVICSSHWCFGINLNRGQYSVPLYCLCPVSAVWNWPHFLHVFASTVRLYGLFGVAPASTVVVGALVCGLVSELLTQEGLMLLIFVLLVRGPVVS